MEEHQRNDDAPEHRPVRDALNGALLTSFASLLVAIVVALGEVATFVELAVSAGAAAVVVGIGSAVTAFALGARAARATRPREAPLPPGLAQLARRLAEQHSGKASVPPSEGRLAGE